MGKEELIVETPSKRNMLVPIDDAFI